MPKRNKSDDGCLIHQTTGGSWSTWNRIYISNGEAVGVRYVCIGRKTGGSPETYCHAGYDTYERDAGGTTKIGMSKSVNEGREPAGNSYDARTRVSGTTCQMQVRGKNAHSITWHCFYSVQRLED